MYRARIATKLTVTLPVEGSGVARALRLQTSDIRETRGMQQNKRPKRQKTVPGIFRGKKRNSRILLDVLTSYATLISSLNLVPLFITSTCRYPVPRLLRLILGRFLG